MQQALEILLWACGTVNGVVNLQHHHTQKNNMVFTAHFVTPHFTRDIFVIE